MACCLTAPSHYLNHCVDSSSGSVSESDIHLRVLSQKDISGIFESLKISLKIPYLKFHLNFPRANELKQLPASHLGSCGGPLWLTTSKRPSCWRLWANSRNALIGFLLSMAKDSLFRAASRACSGAGAPTVIVGLETETTTLGWKDCGPVAFRLPGGPMFKGWVAALLEWLPFIPSSERTCMRPDAELASSTSCHIGGESWHFLTRPSLASLYRDGLMGFLVLKPRRCAKFTTRARCRGDSRSACRIRSFKPSSASVCEVGAAWGRDAGDCELWEPVADAWKLWEPVADAWKLWEPAADACTLWGPVADACTLWGPVFEACDL